MIDRYIVYIAAKFKTAGLHGAYKNHHMVYKNMLQ